MEIYMLTFHEKIYDVNFNVSFTDRICFLRSASGSGKSLLLRAIASYCETHEISCVLVNYNFEQDCIYQSCTGKEVILLDDAELYLTQELFAAIRDLGKMLIVVKQSTYGLDMHEAHIYRLSFEVSEITTRRIT
jgi:hypothetical protein